MKARQRAEEKEKQKQNLLELFPMAIFQGGEEGSRRRSEDQESDFVGPVQAE